MQGCHNLNLNVSQYPRSAVKWGVIKRGMATISNWMKRPFSDFTSGISLSAAHVWAWHCPDDKWIWRSFLMQSSEIASRHSVFQGTLARYYLELAVRVGHEGHAGLVFPLSRKSIFDVLQNTSQPGGTSLMLSLYSPFLLEQSQGFYCPQWWWWCHGIEMYPIWLGGCIESLNMQVNSFYHTSGTVGSGTWIHSPLSWSQVWATHLCPQPVTSHLPLDLDLQQQVTICLVIALNGPFLGV